MTDPVMEWLLEKENPSVRYFTLTSLLDRPTDDPDVKAVAAEIMTSGIVPDILAKQDPDGFWSVPERFYRDKYKGTVWVLLLLAELGANPHDPRIKKACEFIFDHSQSMDNFGFSYDQSAKTGKGLTSGVIPCLTGNLVYSLIRLGFLEDERVQKAINWILLYQRSDDKIDQAPAGDVYERFTTCWGRHSCHMGVAKTLKALAAVPEEKRNPEMNTKIDEMAEYFLKHHIYKKSHDLDRISRPGWLNFGFPLMYQTDVPELLEIFASLKRKDPRLQDAIAIVKNKMTSEGKWILENSFNGKTIVNIEKKGLPSKWITLRARKILRFYGEGILD